jgi:hypothetical protein
MNNLNKFIIASLLGASVVAASANADQLDKDLMQSVSSKPVNATGAYAFAGAGIASVKHRVNENYEAGIDAASNFNTDKNSVFSHIGFGYGFQIKEHYYAAIESAYDYSFGHNSDGYGSMILPGGDVGPGETYYTVRAENQVEINGLFGRTFYHDYLGFVKAGFVGSWNKYTIGWSAAGVSPYDPINPGYSGSVNNFRKGLNLGLGVRMPIAKRIQLVAEYDYMNFFTHGYTKTIDPVGAGDSPQTHNITDNMHSNNFIVSLLYKI